jgi:hypothetical protein
MEIGLGRIEFHHASKPYAVFCGLTALNYAQHCSTIWAQALSEDSAMHLDRAQNIDENHFFYETDVWSTIPWQLLSTGLC